MRTYDGVSIGKKRLLGFLTLIVVSLLVVQGGEKPLWKMTLYAHNYPQGLRMEAFGDRLDGDLYEINIVNHYVGMEKISPEEIDEMRLFPFALAGIVVLALLAALFPSRRWILSIIASAIPLGVLAVIQIYLYKFGHELNPHAPFRIDPFTPLVLGKSTIYNFTVESMVASGFWMLFGGGLLIGLGPSIGRFFLRPLPSPRPISGRTTHSISHARVILLAIAVLPFVGQTLRASDLQAMIDRASPGATLHVPAGRYAGPIRIEKSLHLYGDAKAEIRGTGKGNVVTIDASDVTLDGFLIRLSGKEVSEEAAGIRSSGNNVTIANNEVTQVFFGIHVTGGTNNRILGNRVHPCQDYGERPGHAITIWNVEQTTIHGNTLYDARDGVLLTYVKEVTVDSNFVTNCRYGLHSMYSKNIRFTRNHVWDNLLGVALMYSDTMTASGNVIRRNLRGSSAYGFLLKDLDNLRMFDNVVVQNQIGLYADGLSGRIGSHSFVSQNIIAHNEVGVALQSQSRMAFWGNTLDENLIDVQARGDHLSKEILWSKAGKGNHWTAYTGFDRGDGVGGMEYRMEDNTGVGFRGSLRITDRSLPERALLFTPGHLLLETALRLFPIFRRDPILIDSFPLVQRPSRAVTSQTPLQTAASGSPFSTAISVVVLASALYWFRTERSFKWRRRS